jgi:hypothetical protein
MLGRGTTIGAPCDQAIIVDRATKIGKPTGASIDMVLRVKWNSAIGRLEVLPWSSGKSQLVGH